MASIYKKLILDPRCFKPFNEVNDGSIYTEAISAINEALLMPHITDSEKKVLEAMILEVRKNRFKN
jgi:hypothetical protein